MFPLPGCVVGGIPGIERQLALLPVQSIDCPLMIFWNVLIIGVQSSELAMKITPTPNKIVDISVISHLLFSLVPNR